jgi:hypothetical protein
VNKPYSTPYRQHPSISKDDLESEADEEAYALPTTINSTRRHVDLGECDK